MVSYYEFTITRFNFDVSLPRGHCLLKRGYVSIREGVLIHEMGVIWRFMLHGYCHIWAKGILAQEVSAKVKILIFGRNVTFLVNLAK